MKSKPTARLLEHVVPRANATNGKRLRSEATRRYARMAAATDLEKYVESQIAKARRFLMLNKQVFNDDQVSAYWRGCRDALLKCRRKSKALKSKQRRARNDRSSAI